MQASPSGLHEPDNMFLFREGTAFPAQLQIETTSRCNLKCPNCRRTIDFPDAAESLSEDVLKEFAKIAVHLDSMAISGWGESLMGKSIEELLDIAAKAGISSSITTNGTLLSEPRCRMIIEKRVGTVAVSIDAGTPEGYARLRPGGVPFEKVIEGVRRLTTMRRQMNSPTPNVHLAMVYHDDSARELIPLINLVAEELPLVNRILLQVLYFSDFAPQGKNYRLSESSVALLEEARKVARRRKIHLTIDLPEQMMRDSGRAWNNSDAFHSMPSIEAIREQALVPSCNAAWENPFIDAEGKVYPCCIYPESFGSLKESTFEEIWHGEKFRAMRAGLHNGNPSEHCRNCRKTFWYSNRCDASTPSILDMESPGFIGLGWYAPEKTRWGTGFRWSRDQADVFLDASDGSCLFFEAAALEGGCKVELSVNGCVAAQLRVHRNWQVYTLPVEVAKGALARISFRCLDARRHPDNGAHWWHRRKLGIALTRIGFCASPDQAPRRNPSSFSDKLWSTFKFKLRRVWA